MRVNELNRDQLVSLKQAYLCGLAQDWFADEPSYEDLANADALVSDKEICDAYEGVEFVPEDFPDCVEND